MFKEFEGGSGSFYVSGKYEKRWDEKMEDGYEEGGLTLFPPPSLKIAKAKDLRVKTGGPVKSIAKNLCIMQKGDNEKKYPTYTQTE